MVSWGLASGFVTASKNLASHEHILLVLIEQYSKNDHALLSYVIHHLYVLATM